MANKQDAKEHNLAEQQAAAAQMPFQVVSQYIADLSFENPHGMRSLVPDPENPPEVKLNINMKTRQAGDNQFEVLLIITAKTVRGKNTLFIVELVYGAAVVIKPGLSEDDINNVILREVPRYMYPFAREIVADVTRRAGFPPLQLAAINFDNMFDKQTAIGEGEGENNDTQDTAKQADA